MAVIDIGMDFETAEKDADISPLPNDDYRFQVKDYELGESGENSKVPGRPKINWQLQIVENENPDFNGRIIFYNTSLPWTNPNTGEFDSGGMSFLTKLAQSVGVTWEGTQFDPDALVGQSGLMRTGIKEYNGQQQNEVKKLHNAPVST